VNRVAFVPLLCLVKLAAQPPAAGTTRFEGGDANTISVKTDDGICIMRFSQETEFWRGETSHDPRGFIIGDDTTARATVNYPSGELIADYVDANLTKADGKITKVGPGGVVVAEEMGVTSR
jgi:hypothetical protein